MRRARGGYLTGGNQTSAQGEGFGDYLAAAHSVESGATAPGSEFTKCIMEWDATSYDTNSVAPPGICLRRVDDPDSRFDQVDDCPWGSGNYHCVGQAWSSALYDLRVALGDDLQGDSVADTVVLLSHELAPPGPTFAEAAKALLDADDSEYPLGFPGDGIGQHCLMIRNEMLDREFLDSYSCLPIP